MGERLSGIVLYDSDYRSGGLIILKDATISAYTRRYSFSYLYAGIVAVSVYDLALKSRCCGLCLNGGVHADCHFGAFDSCCLVIRRQSIDFVHNGRINKVNLVCRFIVELSIIKYAFVINPRYVVEAAVAEDPAREQMSVCEEAGGVKLRKRVESLRENAEEVFVDDECKRTFGGELRAEAVFGRDGDYLIFDFDLVKVESAGERLDVDFVFDVSGHYNEDIFGTGFNLGRQRVIGCAEKTETGYRIFERFEESFNIRVGAQSGGAYIVIIAVRVDFAEDIKTFFPNISFSGAIQRVVLLRHKLLDAGDGEKRGFCLFERDGYIVLFLEIDGIEHIDDVGLMTLEGVRAGVVEIMTGKELDIHIFDGEARFKLFAEERRKGVVCALEDSRIGVALYDFHDSAYELVKTFVGQRCELIYARSVQRAAEISHKHGRRSYNGVDDIKGVNGVVRHFYYLPFFIISPKPPTSSSSVGGAGSGSGAGGSSGTPVLTLS